MVPEWLHILSILSLLAGGISAAVIAVDEWRDPQHMWIVNDVGPRAAVPSIEESDMTMKFSVPDMSCGHCTAAIEKAVREANPGATVTCSLDDKTVAVDGAGSPQSAIAAIRGAGYTAEPVGGS